MSDEWQLASDRTSLRNASRPIPAAFVSNYVNQAQNRMTFVEDSVNARHWHSW